MTRQAVHPGALPRIGQPFGGGFYAGRIFFNGQEHALVDSGREHELSAAWWDQPGPRPNIRGAGSYQDGRANTQAMAAAGSSIAEQVLSLSIKSFDDWYLPALDELQVMRMNLCQLPKWDNWHNGPGAAGRGPEQAFCHGEYWTSTQRNAGSAYAMVMRPWCNSSSNWAFKEKGIRPIRSIPIKALGFIHEPASDGPELDHQCAENCSHHTSRDAFVAVVERFVNEDSGRFYGRADEFVDALVSAGEPGHA